MAAKCTYLAMMVVMVVVVVAGPILASAQRCPFAMDIAPCLCTQTEAATQLDMDCSQVVDVDQLMRIFRADFPSTKYRRLTMIGDAEDPVPLVFLPDDVFGTVTFQEIIIQHTQIRRVDDYALLGSNSSLKVLTVSHSELTSFPTTILPVMAELRQLDLSHNHLAFIPDLRSSSLRSLTLAHNAQLSFTDQALTQLDHLVDLNLGYCNMEALAPGMFLNMVNLSTVYLDHNTITHLDADSLHFTSYVIEEIVLSGNQITSAEPNFLSGTGTQTYLELLDNRITTLAETTWRPVFQGISDPGHGLVMLDGNPLDCGCSLAWLVTSRSFLSHLARGAACENGTAIHDLDSATFEHDCSY